MKIYAEDFQSVGFYISHKNEALSELAQYNLDNFDRRQSLCNGLSKRVVTKADHPHESHDKLPTAIAGKHFNGFKEICKCLSCYKQS